MTLEELMKEVTKDFGSIDEQNLGSEGIRIQTKVFTKYQRYYADVGVNLEKLKNTRKILVSQRRDYYSGNASAEEYQKEPFDLIIKSETQMQKYLDNDRKLVKFDEKIIEENKKMEIIKHCLDEIKTLGYTIKTAVDWYKFTNGAI